jgi:Lrp/AsnC family leucine-responsive transcriptional regulator
MKAKQMKDTSSSLDAKDWKTLELISHNGRLSWADLATELGLSAPAATDRVHRLEELGVIRGYAALVDPAAVGLGLLAFLGVVMEHPKYRARFLTLIRSLDEVLECHHVTGDFDYLLKVRCRDTEALERLISDGLKGIRALVRTRTMIALSSIKETMRPPLTRERPPETGAGRRRR